MSMSFKTGLLSAACLGLVACGGGGSTNTGGGGGGGGTTDTTAPTVSFAPTTLTVVGGSTGASTLTATDNVAVTSTTTTCTNGGTFASNTFTAPDVNTQTTSVCTATASDAAGNSATATLTVTIDPAPDTENPVLSFAPATLTVDSNGTAMSTLTATDNRGITVGPDVTCNNGGTFDVGTNTYLAPPVTLDDTDVCTATASDDAGNSGTATLNVNITAPDTEPPMASFNPMTITLDSATTATVTLTATDNIGVVSTNVVCDNGGSWAADVYTAPTTTTNLVDNCTATVQDAAGNPAMATFTANVTGVMAPTSVNISGKITFDLVPHNTTTNGLDYNNTTQSPARGVTLEAIDGSNTVLDTDVTDENGDYSVDVALNTDVRIRVKAEMMSMMGASWDVKVVDSSSGSALYAIQGSLTSSGSSDSTRNLNADSGWGGSSYTSTRAAGPFAILDPIYTTIQKFVAVDSFVSMPPLLFNWYAESTEGSFYTGGEITLLGDSDSDTDEYDRHVIVHEWGHYFEDNLSRSDSIGGPHSGGDRLDPRIAFGEGFGNALSGMILDDPFYRDSGGAQNASGFSINVESNSNTNPGWFNEGSVQSILYDIYDSADDGADAIASGLGPIYETLVSASYTSAPYFTTIFNFIDQFNTNNAGIASGVNALVSAQTINGTGQNGSGETNTGAISDSIPVYKSISVAGGAVQLCNTNSAGTYNKLGNRNYLEFTPTATGGFNMSMTRTSGLTGRDPDFVVFTMGAIVVESESGAADTEVLSAPVTLTGGTTYVIDAYDWQNVGSTGTTPGDSCFDFTITN